MTHFIQVEDAVAAYETLSENPGSAILVFDGTDAIVVVYGITKSVLEPLVQYIGGKITLDQNHGLYFLKAQISDTQLSFILGHFELATNFEDRRWC